MTRLVRIQLRSDRSNAVIATHIGVANVVLDVDSGALRLNNTAGRTLAAYNWDSVVGYTVEAEEK